MRAKLRLRSNADFQRIRREGHTLVHPLLVLSTLSNSLPYSRFGFVVGRRLGKAAERNRLKRRMREAVRVRIRDGQVVAGWDVVLVARHPLRAASFRQIDQAVDLLLCRAGLSGSS
ncbi:MAG: ribonuclease P protein component [Anaerolineae bacterium]|nr:ribonuclease P protein component [Anaerolineae bacterium]